MTDGHKHHFVVVPSKSTPLARLADWARRPLPLMHFTNLARVDASPYPYRPCDEHERCWCLTPLGIAHRWTGLTLIFEPSEPDAQRKRAQP